MAKQPSTLGVPHHHVKKAVLWYIIIILIGVASFYVYRWWYERGACEGPTCAENIKDYSLGAEVTDIDTSNNQLSVRTGWVSDGEFVYYDRTVNLTSSTEVLAVTRNGTVPALNNNPINYFRVGDKITVYGEGTPYGSNTLTATKIEVQR